MLENIRLHRNRFDGIPNITLAKQISISSTIRRQDGSIYERPPSSLKLYNQTPVEASGDVTEIERIHNNKQNKKTKEDEYFVQWKGFPSTEHEWVKTSDFQDLDIIRKYWNAGKRQRTSRKTNNTIHKKAKLSTKAEELSNTPDIVKDTSNGTHHYQLRSRQQLRIQLQNT
ncbi:hypothetical protein ROZALSC1DRAFT_31073 [Rozella allomycis CSF55]|uniref:Chromo domain-containing protein n=1 Tax=Rozella allomycis (strain CSF55) TaxID=988480 RepID=A0A075B1S3_ROZAC|nr:hypothetical protein O9G_005399 [Rozella allomycis CSF55]RKP17084.1 hypothetical protein ROZALSC1DRAFT_31073 [Rozella allomycis CSF55]|eukprot:EPZ36489.1 hypothetical protein O9G_005399 [Rozella allomycis CSF55]